MLVEQLVTIATSIVVTTTTSVVGITIHNYIKEKRREDKEKDAEFELARIQLNSLIKAMIHLNKDSEFESVYNKFYNESIAHRRDLQELLNQKL